MRIALAAILFWLCALLVATPPYAAEGGTQAQTGGPSAYVSVAGAPGDGQQALATALAKRLSGMGVKQATAFEANIYDIQGTVRVSSVKGSRETVTIVWVVLDPSGISLASLARPRTLRKGRSTKNGVQPPMLPLPPRQPTSLSFSRTRRSHRTARYLNSVPAPPIYQPRGRLAN